MCYYICYIFSFQIIDTNFEAPHSPGQYGSQIFAGVGSHFSSFLGSQCSAADPLLESSQGSGSVRQQGGL